MRILYHHRMIYLGDISQTIARTQAIRPIICMIECFYRRMFYHTIFTK